MRYIKQFGIIIVISLVGELLKEFLPFSMPGSIYGLVIMLILLMTGLLKLEQVKEVGDFFLQIMPIFFIPPAVGLMVSWEVMQQVLIPILILCIFGTIVVMGVTGGVTQFFIRRKKGQNDTLTEGKEVENE